MNYVKLVPRIIRQAIYLKFEDKLQRLTATDPSRFLEKVRQAVREALGL